MTQTPIRTALQWTWCVAFLAFSACTSYSQSADKKPEKPSTDAVATVNGVAIAQKDFEYELGHMKQRMMQANGPGMSEEQEKKFKEQVLNTLIDRELFYQESHKKGNKATEDQVNARIADIKKNFPSDAEFQTALEKMGLTEAMLTANIERMLTIESYIEKEIKPRIAVSDEEVKTFYNANPQYFRRPEQIQASHILIKVAEDADEKQKAEAMTKIKAAQDKIKGGEDFADVAKAVSEDGSAAQGGDLGYFGKGQMVAPFEEAAFALEKNQVSDIVTTRFGYHLIKLLDRKAEGTVSLEDSQKDINSFLKDQKISQAIGVEAETLRKTARRAHFKKVG